MASTKSTSSPFLYLLRLLVGCHCAFPLPSYHLRWRPPRGHRCPPPASCPRHLSRGHRWRQRGLFLWRGRRRRGGSFRSTAADDDDGDEGSATLVSSVGGGMEPKRYSLINPPAASAMWPVSGGGEDERMEGAAAREAAVTASARPPHLLDVLQHRRRHPPSCFPPPSRAPPAVGGRSANTGMTSEGATATSTAATSHRRRPRRCHPATVHLPFTGGWGGVARVHVPRGDDVAQQVHPLSALRPTSALELLHRPGGRDGRWGAAMANGQTKAATANRCATCRKKVGLTGFKCRCGGTFGGWHRHAEAHSCGFDYKSAGREQISKQNPLVVADKLTARI